MFDYSIRSFSTNSFEQEETPEGEALFNEAFQRSNIFIPPCSSCGKMTTFRVINGKDKRVEIICNECQNKEIQEFFEFEEMIKKLVSSDPICKPSHDNSDKYCVKCKKWLCLKCVKEHKNYYSNHILVAPIEYLHLICTSHSKKNNFYCKLCRTHFCEDCREHFKHDYEKLEKCFFFNSQDRMKDILQIQKKTFQRDLENIFEKGKEKLEEMKKNLENVYKETEKHLNKAFEFAEEVLEIGKVNNFEIWTTVLNNTQIKMKNFDEKMTYENAIRYLNSDIFIFEPFDSSKNAKDLGLTRLSCIEFSKRCFLDICPLEEGSRIAAADTTGDIYIYDLKNNKLDFTIQTHTKQVMYLAEMIVNKLVSSSFNGKIQIWEIKEKSFELSIELVGHMGPVYQAVPDKNGLIILSGSKDRRVKIWTIFGECQNEELMEDSITSVLLIENLGHYACATVDNKITFWGLERYQKISEIKYAPCATRNSLIETKNGEIISCSFGIVTLIAYSSKNAYEIVKMINFADIFKIRAILNLDDKFLLCGTEKGLLYKIDLEKKSIVGKQQIHDRAISSIIKAEDKIITCSWDSTIKLWK